MPAFIINVTFCGKETQRRECALIFAKNRSKRHKACSDVARPRGVEPPTYRLGEGSGRCSSEIVIDSKPLILLDFFRFHCSINPITFC